MPKIKIKKPDLLKDPKRRSFLKNLGLLGVGLVAGRLLSSLPFGPGKKMSELERLLKQYPEAKVAVFGNFVVQESNEELSFFTRDGSRILVLEKD